MTLLAEETDVRLDGAAAIGAALCDGAFWNADRTVCAWMGRTEVENPAEAATSQASVAVGEHLYAGTAGIALFLAELHGRTGDPAALQAALGALRRSVRRFRARPGHATPLSFYSAHLGAAYVGARLAELAPGTGADEDVEWLLDQVNAAASRPHPLDLLNGNAGAIPVLLRLSGVPGLERCGELARSLADELAAEALREGELCSWNATRASGEGFDSPPMSGFSHGAAGMALALLEVHARTGDPALLRTARGAFAYEDALYSPSQRNWLDVRRPHLVAGGDATGTFQTAWCHGAPGIALARLRARELDPERADAYEEAARAGLATTAWALDGKLESDRFDATLCHGVAGLAEVLLIGGEMLDDDELRTRAESAATELVARYGEAGDYPSGAPNGGPNPTLMLGTAGIGHFLLRAQAPDEVPPVLMIRP